MTRHGKLKTMPLSVLLFRLLIGKLYNGSTAMCRYLNVTRLIPGLYFATSGDTGRALRRYHPGLFEMTDRLRSLLTELLSGMIRHLLGHRVRKLLLPTPILL